MIRLRRALFVLSAAASTWAGVLTVAGGFAFSVGFIRLSSNNPRNPALIALLSAVAAAALTLNAGRDAVKDDWCWVRSSLRWLRWVNPAVTIATAGIALAIYQWEAARPLWLDEEMIALNIRDRSVADLATPLWLGQSAPFGWLAAQRGVVITLGTSEQALRLIPVFFGIATVALALWASRRWMGTAGAAVFVLLCAFAVWLSHYPLEIKHYSADAFWGLFLPVLGAWTVEAPAPRQMRRGAIWCAAAAVGHWFANGAALVAPACALILFIVFWQRGWRAAARFSLFACAWVASFALHYLLVIRHTLNSDYLRHYWESSMPPATLGWSGTTRWLAAQLEPLAINPAGSGLWLLFWLSVVSGFAFTRERRLGMLVAMAPVSAFVLAAVRLVPLVERLSLWIVPALLFGVALFVDRAVQLARDGYVSRSWIRVGVASGMLLVAVEVCSDIVANGMHALAFERPRDSKQGTDDRSGVEWLMREHRVDDLLLTTHLGLPAVWWYGRASLAKMNSSGERLPDGTPIFEMGYANSEPDCRHDQLRDILEDHPRVLVYLGFPDRPDGFDDLVLTTLRRFGDVAARRDFSLSSRAVVIGLHQPLDSEATGATPDAGGRADAAATPEGCVVVRRALRW